MVYAVIGAVFGEYVGAREGLGIWMQLTQNAFRTDLVFAAIVVTSRRCRWRCTRRWACSGGSSIPWAPGVRHETERPAA